MLQPPRNWTRGSPRLALMLLLAVGLLAQSLLDISGQTHEAMLHADAAGGHVHHPAAHDHQTPDQGDNGQDPVGTLHLLMHQPCSGHCTWMDGAGVAPLSPVLVASGRQAQIVEPVPAADYTAPFRPPILA